MYTLEMTAGAAHLLPPQLYSLPSCDVSRSIEALAGKLASSSFRDQIWCEGIVQVASAHRRTIRFSVRERHDNGRSYAVLE